MQEFTLPDGLRFTEELGFDISFQEVCIRGSKHKFFEVKVSEEGVNDFLLTETYQFKSWNNMKKQYPNLIDFLKEISKNDKGVQIGEMVIEFFILKVLKDTKVCMK